MYSKDINPPLVQYLSRRVPKRTLAVSSPVSLSETLRGGEHAETFCTSTPIRGLDIKVFLKSLELHHTGWFRVDAQTLFLSRYRTQNGLDRNISQ